ncbi:hypothetical protein HYALB_00011250 [Hymenoscyphus albidus]|uniref:Phosphoribosyltransferase domain-containing protein n=1 Tax=Hymenoscyphus albidus TaxID=595503 RepID=A0A9N9QA71_9HELO|nr:hypothetical protein HYALB_00011250 [Hymenoscyphus albidus]
MASAHFTEPTTHYWQEILPANIARPEAPWKYKYSTVLPDNRIINLPIRPLPPAFENESPKEAVASLFLTQASLLVVDELGSYLGACVRERFGSEVEVVIGLPTLGLGIAGGVAKSFGHIARFVALGYSKKFWYTEELSTSLSSITSVDEKKVYIDPNQLPLVKGKKAIIIDDVISSGKTVNKIWDFLASAEIGCNVIGAGFAMAQGSRWKEFLGEERSSKLVQVFASPLLKAVEGGWIERE